MKKYLQRLATAGASLVCFLLATASPGRAATFQFADITTWVGESAGVGVKQAALVVDWADARPAFVWGYRWRGDAPVTGGDMLAAILGADARLTASGLAAGFISNIGWNGERFRPGYNATTQEFWNFAVNNLQQSGNFIDGAAPTGAHILPPLGSPYDEAGPGMWVSSNTGVLGHPLVDGAWEGFRYATFDAGSPGLPVNVPEPSGMVLLGLATSWYLGRRRS
jgi:hypothetical protein